MGYFDDVQFIAGGTLPSCTAQVDHQWRETHHLQFMQSGEMYYAIDGGEDILFTEPTVFWHHPEHWYRYGAPEGSSWHHHWFTMTGPRIERIFAAALMPLSPECWLPVHEPESYADIFHGIVNVIEEPSPQTQMTAVLLLERLTSLLLTESTRQVSGGQHRELIESIMASVRRDPVSDCDFAGIAAENGLSYSHFRQLFRRHAGRGPHDYLLTCRMQAAARELQDDSLQVKDVALSMGYRDPAQFTKLFRKKIGLSPRQFRMSLPGHG